MNVKKQKMCAISRCLPTWDIRRSHFRFPREHERWLEWVHASGRLDLLPKGPEYSYRNCRLCHLHFESKWYKENKCRRYLHPDAVPTIFCQIGCEQQNTSCDLVTTQVQKEVIKELQDHSYQLNQ